jgi:CHASE2 domain-containing sensor protein
MKKFWIDSLIATFFVFCVLWSLKQVAQFNIFSVFDPLGKALGDMEITDITFSQLRLEVPPVDDNITIVNMGNLSRAEFAQQIRIISSLKPKVIGIDSFFDCAGCGTGTVDSFCCPLAYDTLSNLLLGNAIADAGNVVMVTKLLQTDSLYDANKGDIDKYDSLERTDWMIRGNAFEGYANLETNAEHQEDLKTCRRFNPSIRMEDGQQELAFSVKISMLFDSVKTKKFLARNKHSEVINYRGNVPDVYHASAKEFAGRYTYLDWEQSFDTTSYFKEVIKDRIVLFGFMGSTMEDTSWDDKFITPLNKDFAGKTRPDMYGVVVHANIISMILSEDYVNELASWQEYAIAIMVCLLNVALFTWITRKIPLWFDGLSILLQLVQIIVCTVLMMYFMKWFNFKLNLTLTLAALALVGTCFELYNGFLREILKLIKRNKLFTKNKEQVLNT